MRLIKSKVEILDNLNGEEIIDKIAKVARTCYKSEDNSTSERDRELVKRLIKSGHEAMIEFADITVKFTCSRAISHELVRHRLCSFAQESQRYCDYSKDKFNHEITFIIPSWVIDDHTDVDKLWVKAMQEAEHNYFMLQAQGCTPQQAREVLPNSTKTEINMKANLREWRHFLKLRCSTAAHPDMRVLALDLLKQFHDNIPIIFDDIYEQFFKAEE